MPIGFTGRWVRATAESPMILPLGDESYTRRVPIVNVALIAINVIVFAALCLYMWYSAKSAVRD